MIKRILFYTSHVQIVLTVHLHTCDVIRARQIIHHSKNNVVVFLFFFNLTTAELSKPVGIYIIVLLLLNLSVVLYDTFLSIFKGMSGKNFSFLFFPSQLPRVAVLRFDLATFTKARVFFFFSSSFWIVGEKNGGCVFACRLLRIALLLNMI